MSEFKATPCEISVAQCSIYNFCLPRLHFLHFENNSGFLVEICELFCLSVFGFQRLILDYKIPLNKPSIIKLALYGNEVKTAPTLILQLPFYLDFFRLSANF